MSFPDDPLPIQVQALLDDEWVNLVDTVVDAPLGPANRLVGDITLTHGRNDENAKVSPASTTLTLWNDDGWLTPDNPGSPWFDWWKRGCQLRVLQNSIVLFWGEVSETDVAWPSGDISSDDDLGLSFVNVTASGILRRLGQGQKPLRSPIHRLATSPTNIADVTDYYPMEEGGQAGYALSGLPNVAKKMELVNLKLAADDTLGGSEPLPSVSSGTDAYWLAPVRGPLNTWIVEQFFRIPTNPTDSSQRVVLMDVKTTGTVARYVLELRYNTEPQFWLTAFASSGLQIESLEPFPDPQIVGDDWVKVRMQAEQFGGDVDFTVGYTTATDELRSSTNTTITVAGTAGRPRLVRGEVSDAPSGGVSVGHLIVHGSRPQEWLEPADIGWVGEKAMWRYIRLSNEQGLIAGVTGDPEDTEEMGRQTALPFLDLLQQCADADGGVLAEIRGAAFGLVMRTRRSFYNVDPALTLDAHQNQIANPFRPVSDDQGYRNDVTVRQIDGATARKFDQWAIDHDNGIYDVQYDLSLYDEDDAIHHAGWRLHTGVTRATRYPQVTIDLAVAPDLIGEWLNRAVGHRIAIINLPPQHPLHGMELLIQGWSESLSPYTWTVTINCSPARPWNVACWEQTRYTAGSAVTTEDIDATQTTFEVESSVRWIQSGVDPEKFPFDIQLGPERMTVTAVVGSGTTQDFTVTRDINGYGRAHDAGTTFYVINEAVDIPQPVGPVMAL